MAEFAMLSSMTGSPRYLFSIQGVSKSQTAGYIFCKLSNVVVRCAPIVNECLCISQNYLFATRFVRWVREGLSALQVWTLVWGLPGPGRASCLREWGGILDQSWLLESFLCFTSLTLILTWSKLYYSVLSGVELVLGLRWTGTLNTKNYTTRSTGDLFVLIWPFIKDFKKKKTLILNSGGGLLPWFAMDLDRAGVKYFIFEPGNQCHIWTIKKLCSFFRHQGSPLLQKSDYIWLYLPQFPYCNYIVGA